MIQITGINGKQSGAQFVFFSARKLEGFDTCNFHWIPTARALGFQSYFIRDTANDFYQKNNRPAIRLLKGIIRGFRGKTIFVGSSLGGYGAILLGAHCLPSKVAAFSPAPPHNDTLPQRLRDIGGYPPIDIHVCKDSKTKFTNDFNDVENALTFKDYAKIIYHNGDRHNVAGLIRESGGLIDLLRGYAHED